MLEDGAGWPIGEAPLLNRFAEEAAHDARRGGVSFVARIMAAWITVRLTIQEKLEPILEETEELLARFAPQLVALA